MAQQKGFTTGKTLSPLMLLRFGFSLLASFAILTVCSKNSFLYPMNDWVDVNCFFTVGRGITHGLVPYRDLYDQKGPLLYFVYALAALISEESFLGVFVIETILFSGFLYLGGRTAELLSGKPFSFWITVSGLGVCVPLSPAFSHGGSAEEFFLPAFAGSLYIVLKAMHEQRPLTRRGCIILGILAAAALWTKYTFCGLFAGLAAAVLIWYLANQMGRSLSSAILSALTGAVAATVLILCWYLWRKALGDLWQAYFVDNLTMYSNNIRGGNYPDPLPNLLNNLSWSIPGALGLIGLLVTGRRNWRELITVTLGSILLFVFTYASGRKYPYYALVMACFAPVGFGTLFHLIPARIGEAKVFRRALACLAVLIAGLSPIAAMQWSHNVYLMDVPKEDMPPYCFAKTIHQAEDQTLLNYGFLDGGFYFAAGSLPTTRFFCTLNNNLPEMSAEQRTAIEEGQTAYVITRGSGNKAGRQSRNGLSGQMDLGAYRLIDSCSMVYEGRSWTYYLYEQVNEGTGSTP